MVKKIQMGSVKVIIKEEGVDPIKEEDIIVGGYYKTAMIILFGNIEAGGNIIHIKEVDNKTHVYITDTLYVQTNDIFYDVPVPFKHIERKATPQEIKLFKLASIK